ncbi:MAG: lysylphosphatidylglycerol synthase domain-containing protein [Gemmatimonadota bacterium]
MGLRWKRFGVAAFLLLALVFVALFLVRGWSALEGLGGPAESGDWRVSPRWLLAGLGLGTANLLGMAALWVWLARRFGERIKYMEGIPAWLGANLGRYIPGKVWQLAGLAAYMRGKGHSSSVAVLSALALQIVVLVTGLLAAVLALGGRIEKAFGGSVLVPILMAAGLLLLLHPAILRRSTAGLARLLREDSGDGPGGKATGQAREEAPKSGETLLIGLATLAAWWLYGVGLWCIAAGLLEDPIGDPVTLMGIYAASYVVGYIALISPGGLVVREGAMILLLATVLSVPAGVGTVLAVAARVWAIVCELAAFGVAMLLRYASDRAGPTDPEAKGAP